MVQLIEEMVEEYKHYDSTLYWGCRCCGQELFEKSDVIYMNRREIAVSIFCIDLDAMVKRSDKKRFYKCKRNRYLGETDTNTLLINRSKLMILVVK